MNNNKQKNISFTALSNYCETLGTGFMIEYVLGNTINPDGTIYYGKSGYRVTVGNISHYRNNREVIHSTVDDAIKAGYKLAQKIDILGNTKYKTVNLM